jgi:predicted acyltransferase
VLYAGGWAIFCLAFFVYCIDVKGYEKPFIPFKAMGMNPLFAFVMAGLTVKILGRMIHWTMPDGKTTNCLNWFYRNCCMTVCGGDNEYASLMFALCYVALFMGMAMWLYRKKIVIKL